MRSVSLWLLASAFLYTLPAVACSCASGGVFNNPECRIPAGDAIFVGRVFAKERTRISTPPDTSSPGNAPAGRPTPRRLAGSPTPPPPPKTRVIFTVSDWFRGQPNNTVVIATDEASDCDYNFEMNGEYLVFAEQFQGELTVTICSRTIPTKSDVGLVRAFRHFRDGTPVPALYGMARKWPGSGGLQQPDPVAGVTLTLSSQAENFTAVTAVDGSYEFSGIPLGQYKLHLDLPSGYVLTNARLDSNIGVGGYECPINFDLRQETP